MSASSTGAWADAPNVDSPTTAKPSIALRAKAGTSTPAMTVSAATRPYAALTRTRSTPRPSGAVRRSRIAIAAETLVLSRNPCMRTSRMRRSVLSTAARGDLRVKGPEDSDADDRLADLHGNYHAVRNVS